MPSKRKKDKIDQPQTLNYNSHDPREVYLRWKKCIAGRTIVLKSKAKLVIRYGQLIG